MNISSILQQHYRKESTLLIPLDPDSIRHTFAKLSTGDIVRGNFWNPFTSRYKLKLRWDGNTASISGPTGPKMVPLITEITIGSSIDRYQTTIYLAIQCPSKFLNIYFTMMLVCCAFIFCIPSHLNKLLLTGMCGVIFYGYAWIQFSYSNRIIMGFLSKEFSTIDRYSSRGNS
jgi:hypothetical protein